MPQDQERIQLEIMGETFTVKGESGREEILRTGKYLNNQLEDLRIRYPSLNAKNLAILTAFNLTAELLQIKKDYEALVSILDKN